MNGLISNEWFCFTILFRHFLLLSVLFVIMSVVTLDDFVTFDYSTLYPADAHPANAFFNLFAHPAVPFIVAFVYFFGSKIFCDILISIFKIDPKSPNLKNFITAHSALLAVYSGWTCVNVAQLIYSHYQVSGNMYDTLTASKEEFWDGRWGMSFWITHFYISKYYEFIDTWIVLLKGRTPIFLQTYHHAGIVLVMWALSVTHCTPVIVCVLLNSFIHTLMYTYYTFAAFGYSSPLKHYLTQMQIGQFLIGLSTTVPLHFMNGADGKPRLTPAQDVALWAIEWYAVVLIALFAQFYASAYGKKPSKKDDKKE